MRPLVVQTFMTLDGVAQAPGGEEEDESGLFPYGGWQNAFPDDEGLIAEWEGRTEALLLGRLTYDIWSGAWGVWDENAPGLMGEFTRRYNRVPKYVASRTLTQADLGWKNSHLLGPNLADDVAKLTEEGDGEVRVWGSTVLIKSLAELDLIDEYRILQYPLVLGVGKKLFSDGFPLTNLALVESRALSGGVLLNRYGRG